MDTIYELDKISNLLMIGISILVQFIIYPSFKNPDFKNFNKFHKSYSNKMFYLISPIMLSELFSSAILVYENLDESYLISFCLLILIWVLTFMFIVPIHNSLSKKHNEKMVGKMIKMNGLRTLFWSLKYLIIGF
jgi:succinate dehydrogenase/fumarate reductase cytochrome b subunit